MQAVDCPALVRAVSRTLKCDVNEHADRSSTFTFVVLADPQLGLLERYVEKRPLPHHWDRELAWVDQAVRLVNLLDPRPKFVIVCGDLVDAQPGSDYRKSQTLDLLHAFSRLDSSIALLTLPGNHDVGDSPTPEGLRDYTHTWGDDYYSFQINHSDFLVFNSQFWWDDSNCKGASKDFDSWVETQLVRLKQKSSSLPVVFQHIPFFTQSFDEPDDYFNIPQTMRSSMMCKLYDAGVRHVFTGHLHKNSINTWVPPGKPDASDPLHLISSSALRFRLVTLCDMIIGLWISSKCYLSTANSQMFRINLPRFLDFLNRIPLCLRAVCHGRYATTLLGQLDRGRLVACASHQLFRYSTGQASESTSRKGLQNERVSAVLNKMKLTESSLDLGVPLTTGHLGKKRTDKSLVNTDTADFLSVSAYGIAQYVDLDALRADLSNLDAYQCASLPSELAMEVVLISSKYAPTSNTQRDVFIFRNGVVVFWNMSEAEHRLFLTRIRPFCQELLGDSLIEREDLRYCFSDTNTRLVGEDLYLQTHESRTRTNQVRSNDTQANDVEKMLHPLSKSDSSSDFTARDGSDRGDNSSNDNADNSKAITRKWPRLIPVDDPIRLEQFAFSDALSLSGKL
ncbi:hypothetical protein P879_07426 [Paragonimus westermani]|uniref:Serine/threonine-protein phosphatase CPPED1 n=1 Tax=Paragonimus westermani TaxID=34504 RepID=A0A8T0DHB7_9TREM|nr:hypothetical protein P879_07426 [Paragonimus westermani]